MADGINTWTALLGYLEELVDTGNFLAGAKCGLFANNYTPTGSSVKADLTLPTFTGYALSAALTWGTPFVRGDGKVVVPAASVQFVCTDAVTPNQIYGYYIESNPGVSGVAAVICRFTAVMNMVAANQSILVLPEVVINPVP